MAYFQRVMRQLAYFLVGVMLSAVVVLAHAETIPATPGVPAVFTWSYGESTPEAACSHFFGPNDGVTFVEALFISSTQRYCRWLQPPTTYFNSGVVTSQPTCANGGNYDSVTQMCSGYSCPTGQGWSLSGNTCTRPDCVAPETRNEDGTCGCPVGKTKIGDLCVTVCPTGYHVLTPDNGQCEKDCFGDQVQANNGTCECQKGKKAYFSGSMAQTVALQGAGDCQGGCVVKAGAFSLPLGAIGTATTGSTSQWLTPTTTTGATCQGASTTGTIKATLPPPAPVPPPTPEQPADPKNTPDNNKDPENCAKSGGVYMTVNGSGKCASPGPDNSADGQKLTSGKKEETRTNPDGTKTTTTEESTTTTNPFTGEQETTTKKTEKKTGPNGEDLGTTTTESKGTGDKGGKNGDGTKGFCEENPQSPMCKKSSWTGDCDIAPVCDGDAVQCATAKAVWEHRCVNKWAEKPNDLSTGIDEQNLFGDQAKVDAALNKDGTKDFDILATFQAKRQNYLTYASNCSHDLSFDFKGQHYAIDTTALCQIGMVVKVLLHLAAYMALIRILTVKLF